MWSKTFKTKILAAGMLALTALGACSKSQDSVYPQSGSILIPGNGPTKQTIPVTSATTGQLTGTILPLDAQPMVKAVQMDEVFTAMPDSKGNFTLNLPKGNYTIMVTSIAGTYKDTKVGNMQVLNGTAQSVGTVILSKQ
jgi:hypothetical protein